jgi:perosamine synthetase
MWSMSDTRKIPFGRPWILDEDREAIMEVLSGPVLTHGPQGKLFEEEFSEFIGAGAHCVSVSSCMAALHLAYISLGIGPGDEVIVPAQTHTATAHAVEWVGARPVFADCDAKTGNVTAETILSHLTSRTRAISVIHFIGSPCNMPEIMAVAEQNRLKVIEDCAIALGSRYAGKHVGLFGDAGCFSFYPVKHITTGEGGMLVSRHKEIAIAVSKLKAFGVQRDPEISPVPGMYDVISLGLNYRMSELQAALGRSQLRRIAENLGRRAVNFKSLEGLLKNIGGIRILKTTDVHALSSHYCMTVVLEEDLRKRRDAIICRLNEVGVGTSIYYPQPVPRMKYYREKYGYEMDRFQNAAQISDHSVALSVGPHITSDDVAFIASAFRSAIKETGR